MGVELTDKFDITNVMSSNGQNISIVGGGDHGDQTSYRLVSLSEGPGEVRIVNKPLKQGRMIVSSGDQDSRYHDNSSPIAHSDNSPGTKIFINNAGQRIISKTEPLPGLRHNISITQSGVSMTDSNVTNSASPGSSKKSPNAAAEATG